MEISEYGITLSPDELRGIIRGEIGFRKCPDCQGYGTECVLHYTLADDPDQGNEKFIEVTDDYATNFTLEDHPEYSWGECYVYMCDTCKGVGYISVEDI